MDNTTLTGSRYIQDNPLDYMLSAIAYGVVQTQKPKNAHPKGQHFVLLAKNPHNSDYIGILGIMTGEVVSDDVIAEVYPEFDNPEGKVAHGVNFYGTPRVVPSDIASVASVKVGVKGWEPIFDYLSK